MDKFTKTLVIGDVHGDVYAVQKAYTENPEALIIQLGDFGFRDAYSELPNFDSNRLKVLGGNHDEYPVLVNYPHYLGDFGTFKLGDGRKVFFIRGAWSIDKEWRTPGRSWWPEEELNLAQQEECFKLWEKECYDVDIMLTHDAPATVQQAMLAAGGGMFGGEYYPNNTGRFLDEVWNYHQAPNHYFGHWHSYWNKTIDGTFFRCINIDEVAEI